MGAALSAFGRFLPRLATWIGIGEIYSHGKDAAEKVTDPLGTDDNKNMLVQYGMLALIVIVVLKIIR